MKDNTIQNNAVPKTIERDLKKRTRTLSLLSKRKLRKTSYLKRYKQYQKYFLDLFGRKGA